MGMRRISFSCNVISGFRQFDSPVCKRKAPVDLRGVWQMCFYRSDAQA